MGILRLGKPNSKIVDKIKRRHEQPVVKKLKMSSISGTTYEFKYDDITQPLTYARNKVVLEPFASCPGISSCNDLVAVIDEGSKISSLVSKSFTWCSNLSAAIFPSLTSLASEAFAYDSNLAILSCPLIETAGSLACRANAIKDLYLPYITRFEEKSFNQSLQLTSVYCPNAIYIGDSAFSQCFKLSSVVLSNMSNDDLTLLGGTNVFGVKRDWQVSVYVPLSCIDDLRKIETWSGLEELSTIKLVGV